LAAVFCTAAVSAIDPAGARREASTPATIYLTTGEMMWSANVWVEGDRVRFEQGGTVASYPRHAVDRIEYDRQPESRPPAGAVLLPQSLEREKVALEREYAQLLRERERLLQSRKETTTYSGYKQKERIDAALLELNQRFADYQRRQRIFQEKVRAFRAFHNNP
jgi:ElaB/YqjD/DUF883 family membrane-anchored ribosome-binding protein